MRNVIEIAMVFLVANCLAAQAENPDLVETASVRLYTGLHGPAPLPHILISGSRISVTAKLGVLVMLAYETDSGKVAEKLFSTPLWDGKVFEVTAVSGERNINLRQARQMLREILADHFRFQIHWEVEEVPAFELVIRPDGPRLEESPAGAQAYGRSIHKEGMTYVFLTKRSMGQLASILGTFIGQPVVDKTGLTGVYDFTFAFRNRESDDDPDVIRAIATAIEAEFGLTLAPSKQASRRLVIDHAEWPEK